MGRPPIDPAIVLKMLLLSYLYNLSERQVEELCNYYLPAKYFLGLAIDAQASDHATLTVFKERILENGKLRAYERMLTEIIRIAREAGIVFGPLQLVDNTHSVAAVDLAQERQREKEGRGPHDPDARWGCKGTYTVHDEEGQPQQRKKNFYKFHASFNEGAQMITSLEVSTDNRPDGGYLCSLIRADLEQGLPITTCVADRGYDDIEHKFAGAKLYHGLRRCRYVTLARYAIQAYLTAMALDLKQLVQALTGVSLRSPMPLRR